MVQNRAFESNALSFLQSQCRNLCLHMHHQMDYVQFCSKGQILCGNRLVMLHTRCQKQKFVMHKSKKEALAISWVCEKFSGFLLGK